MRSLDLERAERPPAGLFGVPGLTGRRLTWALIGVVTFITLLAVKNQVVEDVGPDELVVIQSPIAGDLDWYVTPGIKYQGFGTVTKYKKRAIYSFDHVSRGDSGAVIKGEGGIGIRFNDGGHGTIYGSVQYELPTSSADLTRLHSQYRTMEAVHQDLVIRITQNAIYLAGPLMSSKESYAEKRTDLIFYVLDQIQNGIYRTRQKTSWVKDATGQERQVTVAEIVLGADGKPERQEPSLLSQFGIHAKNFTISAIDYDKVVEDQIKQQQQITMDVQTAIAEAKKAEQRTITVEQQGKANAAQAKWEQEVAKAREVTQAEKERQVAAIAADREKQVAVVAAEREKQVAETQAHARKNVADLDAQTAGLRKTEQILLGQGEAERKRLVLAADGALAQKLEAYVRVNSAYAAAIKDFRGDWVPRIVMGGQATTTSAGVPSGAQVLIDLLTAKAAKDLALDLGVPSAVK